CHVYHHHQVLHSFPTRRSSDLERLENDTLVLHQGGSSDHVSFYEAGIDTANFIRREPGTAALEPWYHTPFDTIDHISQDRIQERSEEHTSELQSRFDLVCRLLL